MKIKFLIIIWIISSAFFYILGTKQVKVADKTAYITEKVVETILTEPSGKITTTREVVRQTKTTVSPIAIINKPYSIQLGIGSKLKHLHEPIYSLAVTKRVFNSRLHIGAYARTDQELGVLVQFEF